MITKKARILLACLRRAYPRLFAILSGHELEFVNTLADAHAALKGGPFDLIMIGLHFDESRMFDLLRHVRADGEYARVPVVCFRGDVVRNAQGTPSLEGVEAACKAMGADAFFDLTAFTDDTLGNAAVRNMINGLLRGEPSEGDQRPASGKSG